MAGTPPPTPPREDLDDAICSMMKPRSLPASGSSLRNNDSLSGSREAISRRISRACYLLSPPAGQRTSTRVHALGIHQNPKADLSADIFQFRQRRQRFIVLVAPDGPIITHFQLFQAAIFFNSSASCHFGFEDAIEQQFIGVTVDRRLDAHIAYGTSERAVRARSVTWRPSRMVNANGRVAGVIFGIFKERVDVTHLHLQNARGLRYLPVPGASPGSDQFRLHARLRSSSSGSTRSVPTPSWMKVPDLIGFQAR